MLRAVEIRNILTALLEDSGAAWKSEDGALRFRLTREGMVWENACRCRDGALLVYGRYPFPIGDPPAFHRAASRVNSQVIEGAMFLPRDLRPVFRTTARLCELYDARERIAHALEYNGAVVVRFWGEIARYQKGAGQEFPASAPTQSGTR